MNIAILGYGTVGSGVAQVITENQDIIAKKARQPIRISHILDLREFPGDPFADLVTHDYNDIISDPEVGIVVEVMGGLRPAYEFTRQALEAGKSVATSNKELVAAHGAELIRIAAEHNVNYLFEAAVGGGIPLIRTICHGLTADRFSRISGILNGTTNYMLTKMSKEGADYAEVLSQAQANGYAERDPSADVEGYDACRKIAIISSLITGKQVDYQKISTTGITKITTADFAYAHAVGADIKLLGTYAAEEEGTFAFVAPVMVGKDNPLYTVRDVYNAVLFRGNMLEDVMLYGQGAGKTPTASAVVSDVVEEAVSTSHIPLAWDSEEFELTDIGQYRTRFLIRFEGSADVRRAELEETFGSFTAVTPEGISSEFGIVTQEMTVAQMQEKCARTEGCITSFYYTI